MRRCCVVWRLSICVPPADQHVKGPRQGADAQQMPLLHSRNDRTHASKDGEDGRPNPLDLLHALARRRRWCFLCLYLQDCFYSASFFYVFAVLVRDNIVRCNSMSLASAQARFRRCLDSAAANALLFRVELAMEYFVTGPSH